jgi:hypothetical protein
MPQKAAKRHKKPQQTKAATGDASAFSLTVLRYTSSAPVQPRRLNKPSVSGHMEL